jgi:glycogen synthase
VRAYYMSPRRAEVIYNGRNPNLFNPHVSKEDFILSVGRLWDAGKQVSLLTQCDQVAPIVIVGSERHPDSAYRGDERSATLQNVTFEGPKSEGQLRHLYARAAAYAATSRYEPFGLAPAEAALSRCAIIANDIPSFHEIWGDTAFYFRYNDAQDLARAISDISVNRELRVRYANLAYHRARQMYTAERMADEYLALYEQTVRTEIPAA